MRRIYEHLHTTVGDHELVEVALLRETALGTHSRWGPYIRMLPSRVPLSSTFAASELAALQDDHVATYALDRQKDLKARYASLRDRIWGVLHDVSPLQRAALSTVEAYSWAASIVTSRMLSLRGRVHLVPLADMFSYAPNPVGA